MSEIRRYENRNFFEPFETLRREIERLFDDFGTLDTLERPVMPVAMPKLDIYETEKEIVIEADVPGYDKKEINIKLDDDILTISAEKKDTKEEKGKNYLRRERFFGKFERAIKLPDYIDYEKIKAHFKDGVLKIEIPKLPEKVKKFKEISID
ncbi:heat-shock protein Hsp20 [Marinitoga sp. 1135]|uniref:Molecular chaperone (Small heat shock protein) n=1 Tax=Marinitoga piezophila (strain DSM 14283 / JCM 11233 / KA3) TaxID=443254 RepID=H2J3U9_MARPK|nr:MULTISPECIES: Hsp20/alpha crystallin family protein [Marinitoga]AEX85841.1 molecular chaperone (small heat shock protein) [Marinitoga piezophila KA3]APT76281.1 heat-shock protein Hsp20 [Marinitoga sp. 1137]NUU96045.1 heat-shock protein Hsp20 [Marinitoga sp. 1135]NUU97957.1 heat-shock protein Hsp20 [Marinitoga sp. 1138]